jgi:L-2-hydroxyglutarate oxidase LhgO
MEQCDVCIIGGGVIGLAIARELAEKDKSVFILEKNQKFGEGISSRNSEVIHAGLYYPKDSLKAKFCVASNQRLYEYCDAFNIPHKRLGKLVVANSDDEEALESLYQNAINNGVSDLRRLSKERIKKFEPNVRAGSALLVPSTGIIDSHAFMASLLAEAEKKGAMFVPLTEVCSIRHTHDGVDLESVSLTDSSRFSFRAKTLINAAGLGAPRLAERIENIPEKDIPKLHLCRGEYFKLNKKNVFKRLIYPLANKDSKGLGIHSTLDLDGCIRFGPDAEYVNEYSLTPKPEKEALFRENIASYFPQISECALSPDFVSIRPKLQGPEDGFKDFIIESPKGMKNIINLFGIESPGLTCALEIGRHVKGMIS